MATPLVREQLISGVASPLTTDPDPDPATERTNVTVAVPVPDNATTLLGFVESMVALEFTVTVAVLVAAELGVNLKGTTQAAPTAKEPLQTEMLLLEKSVLPVSVTEEIDRGCVPVLEMVTFCTSLVVEVCTVPKLMAEGAAEIELFAFCVPLKARIQTPCRQ